MAKIYLKKIKGFNICGGCYFDIGNTCKAIGDDSIYCKGGFIYIQVNKDGRRKNEKCDSELAKAIRFARGEDPPPKLL
jgi:hypothetical protein